MISKEARRRLPKAAWLHVEWSTWKAPWSGQKWFASWRLANARRFRFGNLVVHVRAPWLEHVARQTYPHLFP